MYPTIMLMRTDTGRYGLVALLAGAEVVVPEAQRRAMDSQGAEDKVSTRQCRGLPISRTRLRDACQRACVTSPGILQRLTTKQVDPFLPAYLSPSPPSLGKELRHLSSSLTTVLNVLFSIFGSAAAVYVASVSGAGYSRETAVILAVLAGVVVGIAEGVLVWIFGDRLKKGREASRKTAREMAKGSGAINDREIEDTQVADGASDGQNKDEDQATLVRIESSSTTPRAGTAGIRLRRKALHESKAVA